MNQLLHAFRAANRDDHPAANRELRLQTLGNRRCPGRHEDRVKGRVRRPATRTVGRRDQRVRPLYLLDFERVARLKQPDDITRLIGVAVQRQP